MNSEIVFDRQRAIAAKEKRLQIESINRDTINNLAIEVDAAQQAYQSLKLINSGYCGPALQQEIQQAQSLYQRLCKAGLLVQALQGAQP
jgi:hypothetical protein